MDPQFALALKAKCPMQAGSNSNSDPTVALDSLTPRRLDEKGNVTVFAEYNAWLTKMHAISND